MALTIEARIKHLVKTNDEWMAINPILLDGEWAVVRTSTDPLKYQVKVGDGIKFYSQLSYGIGGIGVDMEQLVDLIDDHLNSLSSARLLSSKQGRILKEISDKKANVLNFTRNLFDKNSVTYEYYVNYTTGNLNALTNYAASDFIPVQPNTLYTKIKDGFDLEQLAYYDYDKNFVSGLPTPGVSLTTPTGVYFVRLSLKISANHVNSMMFAEGVVTEYEPFLQVIDKTTPLVLQSRNLFNKNTITPNHYVNYVYGTLEALSTYDTSDFIPVKPNTVYTKFQNGDSEQFAFYDLNKNFVSGLATTTGLQFTTPNNAYFVRLSLKRIVDQVNTQMFAEGIQDLYEPYEARVVDYGIFRGTKHKNTIIVAKEGGDFDTIQAAVNASGSSISNPITIKVMPGVYEEVIDIRYKYVSLVGEDKTNCIIQFNSGSYMEPPINMSGGSSLTNLSIISTHDREINYLDTEVYNTYPWNFPGYAIHHDAESPGITRINNCIIKSYQHAGIGIGLHNNQTLIIENTELYNLGTVDTEPQGAVYCHNQQYGGAANQKLIVKNCRLETILKCSLRCEDANWRPGGGYNDLKDTVYSFYNNILWSEQYGKSIENVTGLDGRNPLDVDSWIGYIKLGPDSFGNNIAFINS